MEKIKVINNIESILSGRRIFIKTGYTLGRFGIPSLSAIAMGADLDAFLEGAAFIFCSSSKKSIRILIWEDDGYYLIERRIVSKTFKWPEKSEEEWLINKVAIDIKYTLLSNEPFI